MTLPTLFDADHWRSQWRLRPDTLYLNHGSFGPPPLPVVEAQRQWKTRLDEQPMDFFVRQYTPAWFEARRRLAAFVHADPDDLVFVENATAAVNIVADCFPLASGDEVLLTNHEYGAVMRTLQRSCARTGAAPPRVVDLPLPFESADQVVDAIFAAVTPRTRLLVVSHITSPTAVILPVAEICRRARREGVAVCVDGPHAPAQVDIDLAALDCDFYAASLHKWLSAPFGSGFLYVAPKHQSSIRPAVQSWGRLQPETPTTWFDEFIWSGTCDPSPYLSVPTAIDFLESVGVAAFRRHCHELAQYARHRLVELTGLTPIVPDSPEWYGAMAHVPLPPGDARSLQVHLWEAHRIEVPIVNWNNARYIRVSCHLYNTREQIDKLVAALSNSGRDRLYSSRSA